jgi:hypothetical protein
MASAENIRGPEINITARPGPGPYMKVRGKFARALHPHRDSKQAQVHDGDRSNGQCKPDEMQAPYDRESPLRSVHYSGPGCRGEPFDKGTGRHGGIQV